MRDLNDEEYSKRMRKQKREFKLKASKEKKDKETSRSKIVMNY